MAAARRKDKCNSELPIYEDSDQCKSQDFPCYNPSTSKCVDYHNSESEPSCPPNTVADKYKCNNKWPDYPCYEKKTRNCKNKDGTILLDPIGDIAFAANEVYHGTCDLIASLLTDKKLQENRELKKQTFEMVNNYWSLYGDMIKCPQSIITGEYVRMLPLETYAASAKPHLEKAKKLITRTLKKWRTGQTPSPEIAEGEGSGMNLTKTIRKYKSVRKQVKQTKKRTRREKRKSNKSRRKRNSRK